MEDWHFNAVSFHEAFDLAKDPHQLNNVYNTLPQNTKDALAAEVAKRWKCSRQTGDDACV